ncbi:hypothetical protein ACET3Z_015641 [Daucus carota]
MKIFNRFRRILMVLVFPFPSSGSHRSSRRTTSESSFPRRSSCDRSEPPKTSCSSSYYSSSSHYDEAISDCIEFFNRSSQEDAFDAKISDLMTKQNKLKSLIPDILTYSNTEWERKKKRLQNNQSHAFLGYTM